MGSIVGAAAWAPSMRMCWHGARPHDVGWGLRALDLLGHVLADRVRLSTLWDWQRDRVHRLQRSFLVLLSDDDLTDFSLYHWVNEYETNHRFLERADTPVEWSEVVRSLA